MPRGRRGINSRLVLVSHWEHVSHGSLRELMGSSKESPDKICFEEGCILEDLAVDGSC